MTHAPVVVRWDDYTQMCTALVGSGAYAKRLEGENEVLADMLSTVTRERDEAHDLAAEMSRHLNQFHAGCRCAEPDWFEGGQALIGRARPWLQVVIDEGRVRANEPMDAREDAP